jgi:LmbE family N-acetylglucosaminyl deacetylase
MRAPLLLSVSILLLVGCTDTVDDEFPVREPAQAVSLSKIYWVFAHPDDEALAAAAAINRSQLEGNQNYVVLLSEGPLSSVRFVLWPELVNDDAASQIKCAEARITESNAALSKLGLSNENILRLGFNEGQFSVSDVKESLRSLVKDSNDPIAFRTHSPCDIYGSGLGGHTDHRKLAKAIYELYVSEDVSDVAFFRIGHLDGGFECEKNGQGHILPLSSRERSIKLAVRSEYIYPIDLDRWNWHHGTKWNLSNTQASDARVVAAKSGRYGIAGLSVPKMWKAIETEPECVDSPQEAEFCYSELEVLYPGD